MILNRVLAAARDDDDVIDTGGHGLLDHILNNGFVHQSQHLLGLRLGGGEESGPQTGGGENCFADHESLGARG